MASASDIARAQLLLGGTDRWTDQVVEDAIDAEGSVPQAAVLLLESAATAASFHVDVKAGSQSVTQSHVASALWRAAQRIRDDYSLAGSTGMISTMNVTTGRDQISGATTCCTADDPSTCPGNYCDGCCATCP